MSHPSETLLGLYALDPTLVRHRESLEAHLHSCGECLASLAQIRADDATMREPETWRAATEPVVPRSSDLGHFFVRSAAEDAAAIALLKGFENPDAAAHFVWEDIGRKTEYRTGGVARRLCRLANGMCERQPLYALSLAEAAIRIAELLPDGSYPRKTIHELRGETWKEKANALRFMDRFAEALEALDTAEGEYRQLPLEGLGIVAVQYVRAYVFYEQEQLDQAELLAHRSAAGALHLGDTDRFMRARHLQGEILYERRRFNDAAEIFASILAYGEKQHNALWIARESLTLGQCHMELGSLRDARRLLHRALGLFSELRCAAEETRTQWAIARLHFAEGATAEATHRLRTAIQDLTRLAMFTDAAIAAVDLADILHTFGRTREIPKLLTGVVQTFTAAGKLTAALTALAYLRDAAASGTIAPAAFPHVRRFLARAERQPDLPFVPPPL